MNAEEIRKEYGSNVQKMYKFCDGSYERMLQLLQYAAQMETAAQLAELNDRLRNKFSLETIS